MASVYNSRTVFMHNLIAKALRAMGVKIVRFPTGDLHASPLSYFLRDLDLVLDVGAGHGEFGQECRELGYRGQILSYEPLRSSFDRLALRSRRDVSWYSRNCALGDVEGLESLSVTSNRGHSSTLLGLGALHLRAAPDARVVGQELVRVTTLDHEFLHSLKLSQASSIGLKIDAQGYELAILEGATGSLARLSKVLVELSLVKLFDGGPLFTEVIHFLLDRGFYMSGIRPGFRSQDGQLLQFDGVFSRVPEPVL